MTRSSREVIHWITGFIDLTRTQDQEKCQNENSFLKQIIELSSRKTRLNLQLGMQDSYN